MSKVNPFAFPVAGSSDDNCPDIIVPQEYGMTLRDYFAAKAMQGDLSSHSGEFGEQDDLITLEDLVSKARLYYRVADAMLIERQKAIEQARTNKVV